MQTFVVRFGCELYIVRTLCFVLVGRTVWCRPLWLVLVVIESGSSVFCFGWKDCVMQSFFFLVCLGCDDYCYHPFGTNTHLFRLHMMRGLHALFWLGGMCGADLCGLSWLSLRVTALCMF